MKKRNIRWLLASIAAVVSLGAGISAVATQDPPAEDESSRGIRWSGGEKTGQGGKSGASGIRW